MGEHHPRYLFRHPGGASVPPHELFLQPRSDSDYGLRTKSLSPDGDECMVRDEKGKVIHWKHKVGHRDWVEFHYPFKVYAECPDGHTETLITCDGTELLKAVPIAMPLHEDLELRLSSMVHEANRILDEARGSVHERRLIQQEVENAMGEDFDDEAIEEMTNGTFFRYFVATHQTHGGVRVLLKFMHIVEYNEFDMAVAFSLKFRSAKVLVPHGPEFESFFRHEKSLGSLVLQNNIMRTCINGAYNVAEEMQERRLTSGYSEDGDEIPEEETDGSTERIQGIGRSLKGAAKSVGSSFRSAGKKVGKAASRAGRAVGKKVSGAAKSVGGRLMSAGSRVGGFVSSAASRVRTAASSAAGRVRSGASSIYTGAKSAATRVHTSASGLKDRVKAQYSSVKEKVSNKANEVKDAVGKKFENVKTSVGKARDRIRDKYTSVKQNVRDRVGKIRGKNTTGSASSAPSGTSSNAPQDKIVSASQPGGSPATAAGAASPGDARAPVGSGGRQAPRKDLPPTPGNKAAAAAAKDSGVFQNKGKPPAGPKSGGAQGSKPSENPPRRHGDPGPKPSAPSAKPDDGLGAYRNAPPASTSGTGANTDPNKITTPAPKPPASSSVSNVSHQSTSGSHVSHQSTSVSNTNHQSTNANHRTELKHSATPGSTSTSKVTNPDGTTHTVTAKTRADGTTKVTSTHTSADGKVISKDKQTHGTPSKTSKSGKEKEKERDNDEEKEPKEKKQGTLSKLKDKVTSKGQSSGKDSQKPSGDGDKPSGGDAGSTSPNADLSGTRPDYDSQMRDQDRQQADQDRQAREADLKDVNPYDFKGNLAGAVVAGAVVNSAYQQQQVPPPGGIYGAPPAQTLPPGYAMTANGVMAVGPDGRLYPLTPQQYAEIQLYQQRQQGLVPAGAAQVPPSNDSSNTAPSTTIETYKPSYSVRLADDDELVGGGGAPAKPVAPVSTGRDEQTINDQLTEAADAERRDALYKFMLAEHAASFGKTPTKVQKDKLWARLNNTRPLVIKKIFSAYVEWLTNDTGLRYA